MKLRVATYNIHKGATGIRQRPRIHDVRLALQQIDADIVFLQEVQDRNERMARRHPDTGAAAQLDFLAACGYEHCAYGMNAVYPHGHHGNAILSRVRIGNYTNHDISDHALERRGMLHAVAHYSGHGRARDIHLICAHFGLVKRSRMRQARYVADFVDREIPPGAPLIIAGDLNDWQRRVDRELRRRLGVIEVSDAPTPQRWFERWLPWRAPLQVARTFPAVAPWLTLDRIYLRGLRPLSMRVPRGLAWARRSDHAPLIAELEFG
jgi:endonuclease/exonuclease/phosphatase family metal-dependent hydrolase